MDDDGGDWFTDTADEPAPEAVKEVVKEEVQKIAEETVPVENVENQQLPEAEEFLDPDKFLVFRHWIRPKFLQYNYLYNYRYNYYDDVIDYLDKRQKGLKREVPRAQTWAERALRTYNNERKREEYFSKLANDTKLVTSTKLSGAFFHYHSKQYVNRRYSSILL